MSMPTSAIAATAAGLISSAGSEPADARDGPAAGEVRRTSRRPSATARRCARRGTGPRVPDVVHRRPPMRPRGDDDVVAADVGIQDLHQPDRGERADDLRSTMNIGTDDGRMPAKVLVSVRATVTAGLAKTGRRREPVGRGDVARRPRTARPRAARSGRRPKITSSRPNVATTSPSHSAPDDAGVRRHVDRGSSNMTLATIAPTQRADDLRDDVAPRPSRSAMPPSRRSASVTTGLKCAPETRPNARMSATSPAPVATAFSSSWSPTSSGDSRCAAIPEPDDDATRKRCRAPRRRGLRRASSRSTSAAARRRVGAAARSTRRRSRVDGAQLPGGISASASTV